MPISVALSFASVFTLTIQCLVFAYIYSTHRVRFFRYLLWAWGLMSVAKGLHLAGALYPDRDILGALINPVFFGATLLVLAAGLAFRYNYRIGWRDALIGGLGALVAASLGDLSDAGVAARSLAGFATGGTLILAGFQFWPRRTRPQYRGTRFLAAALAAWGVHRIVSPFVSAEPGTAAHLAVHLAFMFFYFLATLNIIIMVLDRARTETAALKEFSERLVDGLGEGLQLVDGDFRVRHANRWMHEQFGPVLDGRCYELLTADGRQCPACPLDRRDRLDGAERIEVAGVHGRRFSLSCSPVRQADGQIFLLELVGDVTERERLQARLTEAERLAAAGEVAASVAHEIRNPLAAIVNATTLLGAEENLTRDERANTLGAVKKEARRLNRILSDFLILARPREPKRLRGDIREVVDQVAALIREDPERAQRVDIDVSVDPEVPPFAFDSDQMTQVLWNIALNGVEAIEGHGDLRIGVGLRGPAAAITITDTGRGISAEERRRVFEPFYSRKQAGTGLGLAIARRIIAAHGGHIEVESTPGRGSRFTILLPLDESEHDGDNSRRR
jgi:two-component system sensor histidine kinase HydH